MEGLRSIVRYMILCRRIRGLAAILAAFLAITVQFFENGSPGYINTMSGAVFALFVIFLTSWVETWLRKVHNETYRMVVIIMANRAHQSLQNALQVLSALGEKPDSPLLKKLRRAYQYWAHKHQRAFRTRN